MKGTRKLALRRDVLGEIAPAGLGGVVGGAPPTKQYACDSLVCSDTCYSCYTYISCHMVHCLTRTLDTIVVDTTQ